MYFALLFNFMFPPNCQIAGNIDLWEMRCFLSNGHRPNMDVQKTLVWRLRNHATILYSVKLPIAYFIPMFPFISILSSMLPHLLLNTIKHWSKWKHEMGDLIWLQPWIHGSAKVQSPRIFESRKKHWVKFCSGMVRNLRLSRHLPAQSQQ